MQSSQFALGPIEKDSFLGGGTPWSVEENRVSDVD